jgi:hypothetical protein
MPMEDKLILRLEPGMREALETAAKDDQRTVSGYVRKVLSDHLTRRRLLPAKQGKG